MISYLAKWDAAEIDIVLDFSGYSMMMCNKYLHVYHLLKLLILHI